MSDHRYVLWYGHMVLTISYSWISLLFLCLERLTYFLSFSHLNLLSSIWRQQKIDNCCVRNSGRGEGDYNFSTFLTYRQQQEFKKSCERLLFYCHFQQARHLASILTAVPSVNTFTATSCANMETGSIVRQRTAPTSASIRPTAPINRTVAWVKKGTISLVVVINATCIKFKIYI